jgi:hypothetical protein
MRDTKYEEPARWPPCLKMAHHHAATSAAGLCSGALPAVLSSDENADSLLMNGIEETKTWILGTRK